MAKIKKSAIELAELIRRQLGQPKLRVAVYSKASGWHAKVYAAEGSARELQKLIDEAVHKLRDMYELET